MGLGTKQTTVTGIKLHNQCLKSGTRHFSMLDDFESGNTNLNDIIEIPLGSGDKSLATGSTSAGPKMDGEAMQGFNFNEYLVKFALNRSVVMDYTYGNTIRKYSEVNLDFNNVTKTTVEEDEEEDKDGDDSLDLDTQVRSNHFDNYKDSKEVVEMDFGRDIRKFLDEKDKEKKEYSKEDDIYGFSFTQSYQSRPEIYNDDAYYRNQHQDNAKKSPGRVCSPTHRRKTRPWRSNIKVRKNLLNLIVESSDGSLDDATKYATEINSQNSSGIPLPEKTTELVTIPTTGQSIGGIRKAAIVRATIAKAGVSVSEGEMRVKKEEEHAGFYTAKEKMKFVKAKESVNVDKENAPVVSTGNKERLLTQSGRGVKWARTLEW
ncbi:hypothetical protein FOA43_002791 [Brettanomyces nanus]|uniref:Uncharacterized protein n=1 Tax=Eeniella nana TaxID=13502 RepID=A0A875RVD2_EENNA|nr:uncharacterized protein FOA43_002791 [Brettanomyces nanus]QPG75437.1 hypothetical protein FOA43_002791 [Brettanomyces nanus]